MGLLSQELLFWELPVAQTHPAMALKNPSEKPGTLGNVVLNAQERTNLSLDSI